MPYERDDFGLASQLNKGFVLRCKILILIFICLLLSSTGFVSASSNNDAAAPISPSAIHPVTNGESQDVIADDPLKPVQKKEEGDVKKNRFFKDNLEIDPSTLPCMSVGAPSRGRLINGKPLPYNKVWINRLRSRQYATPELIKGLTRAMNAFKKQYPDSAKLITGDISYKNGGPMLPHVSHQAGRDIDVGMFAKNNRQMNTFEIMTTSNLDTRKTWTFIETLLENASIEYILVDYSIQSLLYKYVRFELGASADYLERVFQYPRKNEKTGIIRHSRGHKNHLHLRFHCPISMAAGRKYQNLLLHQFAKLNNPEALPAQNMITYIPRLKRKVVAYNFSINNLPDVPGPKIETTYIVSEGDSLWSIAKKYQVPAKLLCKLNNLPTLARLFPGMPIKVVASEALVRSINEPTDDLISNSQLLAKFGDNQQIHIVKEGESLWSIAKTLDVTIADLCQWNDLSFKSNPQPGQNLVIQKRKPVYASVAVPIRINPNILLTQATTSPASAFEKLTLMWKGFSWTTLKNLYWLLF